MSDNITQFDIFRTKREYFDIEIETSEGSIFYYSKYGLIRASIYFEKMFANNMKESIENKIKVNCFDLTILSILWFCHTDKIELFLDIFLDLFYISHMWDINKLNIELRKYFKSNFKGLEEQFGWVEIMRFSRTHFDLKERKESFRQHYRDTFHEKITNKELVQSLDYSEITILGAAYTENIVKAFIIWGSAEKNKERLIQDIKEDTNWWLNNYCKDMLSIFQTFDHETLLFFFTALSQHYFVNK
jgi:hypothetical protein